MCDVFAQRNTNRTQAQQIEAWPKMIEKAKSKGAKDGGLNVSNCFGSNWTGEVPTEKLMSMFDRMIQAWNDAGLPVTRVGFSDATGWNMPHQVERTLVEVKKRFPTITDFNLHLHNARGAALASIYAALRVLDSGDTMRLQTAIGGMAGCPYCGMGQAAMMIATEDLMHMLQEMGIHTGVDLYGFVSKAGPRPHFDKLYAMDMPRIETLAQAKHFILGPKAYAGAASPWAKPITSWQRPESLNVVAAEPATPSPLRAVAK
jgi:hydroxymethylglutaryl-CoA lyase